jgi:hypothetical protein
VPKLFIGSIHAACNEDALGEKRVSHVSKSLSLAKTDLSVVDIKPSLCNHIQILNSSRFPPMYPNKFSYLTMDLRDK